MLEYIFLWGKRAFEIFSFLLLPASKDYISDVIIYTFKQILLCELGFVSLQQFLFISFTLCGLVLFSTLTLNLQFSY